MRKLLYTLTVLTLIGGALLIAAALSLNRIIANNRDRILERAETTLGRKLAVDRIAVSVWGGIGARLENVRVADDPQFSDTEFLRAISITARAQLWPLLRGRLGVRRIDVEQPHIQIIRDASGRWNYSTLKPLRQHAAASPAVPQVMYAVAIAAAPEAAPLFVARAGIADGTVLFTDRSREPAQTTRLEHIDLDLRDVSVITPIHFELNAALQADARNIQVHGTVGPLQNRAASPLEIEGTLGPFGPQDVRFDAVRLKAVMTPDAVRIAQLDGRAFDGSFSLTGQFPLGREGEMALKGRLSDIAAAKVLQVTMADAAQRFDGAGQMNFDVRATGNSAAAMRTSLAGAVVADVKNGVLKDFNVVNEVLGKATGLPGIGDLLSANVKPKYARLFSEPDTRFDTLHATFRIAEQRIQTDDLALLAADYGLRASGWISFNRETDLAGTLSMSHRFTNDVVADVKEAKYLIDDKGELAVPFQLRGRLGTAKPQPDLAALAATLTRGLAHGGAKDLIERLFGNKPKQPAQGGKPSDNPLEKGLRDLLGR